MNYPPCSRDSSLPTDDEISCSRRSVSSGRGEELRNCKSHIYKHEQCSYVNVNVTDTISWRGHHDRVMQLNWLYFCDICQMMPPKVSPNTALGCNHQSICMPQLKPLCSAALIPNVLPRKDEGSGKPVQWSKPHSILAPTQDLKQGSRIPNHKRWPLHYHCTPSKSIIILIIIIIIIIHQEPITNNWRMKIASLTCIGYLVTMVIPKRGFRSPVAAKRLR